MDSTGIYGRKENWETPQDDKSMRVPVIYGTCQITMQFDGSASDYNVIVPKRAVGLDYAFYIKMADAGVVINNGELLTLTIRSYWDKDATIEADKAVVSFVYTDGILDGTGNAAMSFPVSMFCPVVGWDLPNNAPTSRYYPAPSICLRFDGEPLGVQMNFFHFLIQRIYMPDSNTDFFSKDFP